MLALDRYGSRFSNDVAYMQDISRHRQMMHLDELKPVADGAWVAPNATLAGEVLVSKYATIWYGVTMKAEKHPIRIGHFSSVGDLTTMNTNHSMPEGVAASVNVGKNVRIGSKCVINSCIMDDDVIIGNNVIIKEGARIERGA